MTLGLALAWSGIAVASPPRSAVERALAGIERAPSEEAIRRLGAGTDAVLIEIADDPRTAPVRRARAIRALKWWPSADVRAFLHNLIARAGKSSRGPDVFDVEAALVALVPYGAVEMPALVPFLSHASADVRQGAVSALLALRVPEAVVPLRARLGIESDPGVRAALMRALGGE
jgi:hypothetical protein